MSDEGYEQFERWKKFKNMKRSANEKQKTPDEEQQEFTEFMEFERMNSIYNKRDLNPMHSPKPSTSSSTSSSSTSSTSTLSRTSSEKSDSTSSSKQSFLEGHRHFKIPSLNLTPSEFEDRLKARLPEDVMQDKLITLFKPLSDFRDKYILPLSEKYPGQEIELTTVSEFDTDGFLSAYVALFLNGCHIRRKPRKTGEKVIPDSKEREMYRHLFKDLWGLLGTSIYIYYFNI